MPRKLSNSEALAWIKDRVAPKAIENHRRPLESEWIRSIAYLHGKQHFVSDGGKLRNPTLPPHKVLYKANFIRGAVTRAVATAMANRVIYQAPPRNWSKKSRDMSTVSTKLFEQIRDETRWDKRMKAGLTWAAACGSGFLDLRWDPTKGSPERYYWEDAESKRVVLGLSPEDRAAREEAGLFQDIPPGDMRVDVIPPFQHYWDWEAREEGVEGCMWIGRKQLVSLPVLEEIYGAEKTKGIKPIDWDSEATYFEELLAFMASSFSQPMIGYSIPKDKRRNQTIYCEAFEIPLQSNGYYGRYIATAGDTVLSNGPNPYRKCEEDVRGICLPVIKLDWQTRPGSYIGHGLVPELISPQFQYNRARATIVEAQNIYGHPAMFVPKNSDIPTGMLSIEPGMVYEYNPNTGAATPVQTGPTPSLPKEVADNRNAALQEIQLISSQTDPDMSKLPGQIRGAPGLEMMIEEKNKLLQPVAESCVEATIEAGRRMLSLAKRFYTGQRVVKYVGEDNVERAMTFMAEDLQTNLMVIGEPDYFQSRAASRAKILEYVQTGVLDPMNPDDKLAILKVLAYGRADEVLAERLQDEENQEREWDEMAANPMKFLQQSPDGPFMNYPTQPFDNDETHLRVMQKRMKSPEWRSLDPMAQQLLSQHYTEHGEKFASQQQQAMQQQEAQRGGPGQKGRPSAPKKTANSG